MDKVWLVMDKGYYITYGLYDGMDYLVNQRGCIDRLGKKLVPLYEGDIFLINGRDIMLEVNGLGFKFRNGDNLFVNMYNGEFVSFIGSNGAVCEVSRAYWRNRQLNKLGII